MLGGAGRPTTPWAGRDHGLEQVPFLPRRPVGRPAGSEPWSRAPRRGGSSAPTRVMGRHGTTHAAECGAAPAPITTIGRTGRTRRIGRTGHGGAAMTTICDLDPVVATALSSAVGGSTVVTSLEALRQHLEGDPAEDTVVL